MYVIFKTGISGFLGRSNLPVSGTDIGAVSQSKGFSRTVSNSTETTTNLQRLRQRQMACHNPISRFWSSETQYLLIDSTLLDSNASPRLGIFLQDWQLDLEKSDKFHYHSGKQLSRVEFCAAFKNLARLTFFTSMIKGSTYSPVLRTNKILK